MQKLTYILLSFSIFILSSCETLVENVDLPYQERLVVTSFISPQDSIIEVKVSKTSPTIGKFYYNQPREGFDREGNYLPLEGVTIEISEGQKTVIIPLSQMTYPSFIKRSTTSINSEIVYTSRKGYFLKTKDFPIVAGRTYNITAKAANLPTASASCTIPQKKLTATDYQIIGSDRIDSVRSAYSVSNGVITARSYSLNKPFTIQIKDFGLEENFYTVAYYTRNVYENKDQKGNIIAPTIATNQEPYSDFISDYKRDGTLLEFKKAKIPIGYYYIDQSQYQPSPKLITLLIHVAVIDKPYYQYSQAIIKSGSVNNDDPFSEAVLTYTNVQGGLGVFAGYNTTPIEIKLK
jgi:Domain of unknown function (DUF4249)